MARNRKRKKTPTKTQSLLVPRKVLPTSSAVSNQQGLHVVYKRESYSGAVMHPQLAADWEAVVEGSAERLLAMAEKQATHRQKIEKTLVRTRSATSLIGAIGGTVFALATAYFGYNIILQDKPTLGVGVILAAIGSVVWAFRRTTSSAKQSK